MFNPEGVAAIAQGIALGIGKTHHYVDRRSTPKGLHRQPGATSCKALPVAPSGLRGRSGTHTVPTRRDGQVLSPLRGWEEKKTPGVFSVRGVFLCPAVFSRGRRPYKEVGGLKVGRLKVEKKRPTAERRERSTFQGSSVNASANGERGVFRGLRRSGPL